MQINLLVHNGKFNKIMYIGELNHDTMHSEIIYAMYKNHTFSKRFFGITTLFHWLFQDQNIY